MNNLVIFEIILVSIIVAIQFYIFLKTTDSIRLYKAILPVCSDFKLTKLYIPEAELQIQNPRYFLKHVNVYKEKHDTVFATASFSVEDATYFDYMQGLSSEGAEAKAVPVYYHEISIIELNNGIANKVLEKILESINTYLIRNKGSVSDFNLIKDTVERNTQAVEEDINLTIAVPLYLGLMGTMLGIVIGLFNMSDLSTILNTDSAGVLENSVKNDGLGEGISVLLGGVKIAMIASFTGLLLTVYNSGFYFKGAKSIVETNKNDFYTFIQTELLPVINQTLSATLEGLQRNLISFNNSFAFNIKDLFALFAANNENIKRQESLLQKINEIGVAKIARSNIEIFDKLSQSVTLIDRFNRNMSNVNKMVDSTHELALKFDLLLERSTNVESIAAQIHSNIQKNEQLFEFLSHHIKEIDSVGLTTRDAVIDVNDTLNTALKDLKISTQKLLTEFNDFSIEEADALKKAIKESKGALDNLKWLECINTEVAELKEHSSKNGKNVSVELSIINDSMKSSVGLLESIKEGYAANKNSKDASYKGLNGWIKRIFPVKERIDEN